MAARRRRLLPALVGSFAGDEGVEDRQNALAVAVHAPQIVAEALVVFAGPHPFLEDFWGDIDLLAQAFDRMSPQE